MQELVNHLFMLNKEVEITPALTDVFQQMLTEARGLTRMKSSLNDFAVYNNQALDDFITSVQNYLHCCVVPQLLGQDEVFSFIISKWSYFEKKLGYIYNLLFATNNIGPSDRLRLEDVNLFKIYYNIFV